MDNPEDHLQNENPYAAPAVVHEPAETGATRDDFKNRETAVRTLGLVCVLGSIFGVAAAMGSIRLTNLQAGLVLCASVALCVTGIGLRFLQPWAQKAGTFLGICGLLVVPVGTAFSIYLLYILRSKPGPTVFSAEYKATRQRERTPAIVWILASLVIGAVASLIWSLS